MRSLVEQIENYIKSLLGNSPGGVIEIQRNELAQRFACVPSQINYVLGTRFSVEQGYVVESRRGGGGYLRIAKLSLDQDAELYRLINSTAGTLVSQQVGDGLIQRLLEEGFLTKRETILMRAVIKREALPLELPQRDLVRASILRFVLLALLQDEFNEE
ncbi:MAG: CtsR family transcriptional regulator [Bacillota bacterium]